MTGKRTYPKRTPKYDQDFINSVHSLHDDGNSLKELGKIFDLSRGSIKYILYVLKPTFKDNPDIVEWKKQENLISKAVPDIVWGKCNNTLRFPTWKERVGAVKAVATKFSRWFS